MGLYYCDHTAYATALGATPTWGTPQEGDGSASAAASASGTAGIVLTANPSATNTITVCGVVFTAVASGATGNQFNVGGSLSATIDNIVAAINASSTTVATGVAPGAPQLRNLVFARNTSGTTLEVMMRIGSATLNGATNTNCRMTGSGISTSTTLPVDFSGGSGGCWGLLFNTAAMGVSSSLAALAYGLAVLATPYCAAASGAASVIAIPTNNDQIFARTGAGFTLTCAANGVPNLGGPTYPQHLIFDSNTVWTGDSGTGQITISTSISSADSTFRMSSANSANTPKSIRCIREGALRIFWSASNGSGNPYIQCASTSGNRQTTLIEGVIFETPSTFNTTSSNLRIFGGSSFQGARFKRCQFLMKEARSTWGGLVAISSIDGSVILEGCTVEVNHTAGGDPGTIIQGTGLVSGASLRFIDCRISGWSFGKHRLAGTTSLANGSEVVWDGGTGINLGTTYLGLSTNTLVNPNYATCVIQSKDAGLGYRYEYGGGVVDWNPGASPAYPTRSALLGDNSTPWSVKLDWFNNVVNPLNNLVTPRMASICRLTAAARTIALDFLTPITLTAFDVAMRVSYIGTDDKVYTESTYALAAALSSPGATWAGISNFPSHNSRRLTLTTANSVKQNTEISVYFEVTGNPPGGTGVQLYVDPEAALS